MATEIQTAGIFARRCVETALLSVALAPLWKRVDALSGSLNFYAKAAGVVALYAATARTETGFRRDRAVETAYRFHWMKPLLILAGAKVLFDHIGVRTLTFAS